MSKKYIATATIIVMLIYAGFFFVHYTVTLSHILAAVIFILGVINFFVIRKTKESFPFVNLRIGKRHIKIENHRIAQIGCVFMCFVLVILYFEKSNPFLYICFSTGIFGISFARITIY